MPRVDDFEKFLFIVGAPRSGTTTMARMLQAHPQVTFPFVKEPHFFSQHDLRGLGEPELKSRVEDDYLDHFFSNADPARATGADGSVSYLYAPEQLEPVLKLWPNSRFVVGVRDPMSLLPSLHKRLLFTGDESLSRFEDAWAAVPDGRPVAEFHGAPSIRAGCAMTRRPDLRPTSSNCSKPSGRNAAL